MADLQKTPLYTQYEKYGAKTIDFGGWALPVQFSGIQDEHHAVRNAAGLFDVSHMGELLVAGKKAEPFLQMMTTNHVEKLATGQTQYALMCYPDGGVVDDLLIYKLADERYMLVVNAANKEKDLRWLQEQLQDAPELKGHVQLEDVSADTALLAIQGPQSAAILKQVTDAPLDELPGFHFLQDVDFGELRAMVVSRTGYTGEDGYEIYVHREAATELWEMLLTSGAQQGLKPVGLGARDTLRFEAKLPLYGQELSPEITPLEAGLGFFVKLDKGEFIGREALAAQKEAGVPRKLVGIEMLERGIPRSGYPVYAAGNQIGKVTTGTQSPTLKKNIGLVLIEAAFAELNQIVEVEIRGKRVKAKVVKTPFYKRAR